MSKWFRNHRCPLENLNLKQKELLGQGIPLALPNNTRWKSNHLYVSALPRSKAALDAVAVVPEVKDALLKRYVGKCPGFPEKFGAFLEAILEVKSNLPRLSGIYTYFEWITDTSMDALKGVSDDMQLSVRSILATRWENIRTVLMLLVAVLDTCLSDEIFIGDDFDGILDIGCSVSIYRNNLFWTYIFDNFNDSLGQIASYV
ncbi:hypothetical protein V1504DRAFT_436823 [Lipomyces starkeyi]